MNIIFFGSTDDSVIVASALHTKYPIAAVVTQLAKPIGRNQLLTKTPVALWAEKNTITVLSFPQDAEKPWKFKDEAAVTESISTFHPDILITACFGERIPKELISSTKYGGINVHPSLLPRWRGADPIPWTIIAGDAQTGVTISTITKRFDDGLILAQKKIPITDHEEPSVIRKHLFTLGAALLVETLPLYISGTIQGKEQKEDVVIARKLTRDDGYIPWELIESAIQGTDIPRNKRHGLLQDILTLLPEAIHTLFRALSPWPGIWTTIALRGETKRVKILACELRNTKLIPTEVQLEGKNPVSWDTFKEGYLEKN